MRGWIALFFLFWIDLLLAHNPELSHPQAFACFGYATWAALFLGHLRANSLANKAGAVGQIGLCLTQQLSVYLRVGAFDITAFLVFFGTSLLCLKALAPEQR